MKIRLIIIILIILVAGVVWYFLGAPGLPKSKTEAVEVTSFPKFVKVGELFTVTWQVNQPEPIIIPHTAIHYGPESQSDINYPNFTQKFAQGSFDVPNVFIAVITAQETSGKLYFRAHAIIENKDVWTEEQVIDIELTTLKPLPDTEPASFPEFMPDPTPQPGSEPESEPAPPSSPPLQTSIQEFELEQSVYPGYFFPDPLIVKKGIPLRLLVTTKQREHVNRISIQPWISSSETLIPGKITIIEFTPNQTGDFEIRNIGHGFIGILKVVE